ncbi:hypothetical protein P4E94_08435 [Pontiellaceae bacterium B12219]|nr:hypothetical protein [Pontiellaceae bacterium B12219]
MKSIQTFFICLTALLSISAQSDTLKLRNGKTLEGGFVSSDGHTISFAGMEGVQSYPRSEVAELIFANSNAEAAPVSSPAAPAKKAAASGVYTLPEGTLLIVSMLEEVTSEEPAGRGFKAKLEADLMVNAVTVVPAGTVVFGKITASAEARRLVGRSFLELQLTGISIDGQMHSIHTGNFEEAGPSSLRKVVRNAAVGAAIGSASGGHEDAERGATYGAAASVITKGRSIVVPATAILDFHLQQPLTLTLH